MPEATATFEVRRRRSGGIVDIRGDVTAGSEDALMRPTTRRGDGTRVVLNFTGSST